MAPSVRHAYPFRYEGTVVWPILFAILFPPIAFVLVAKNLSFIMSGMAYRLSYHGSWFWLCFWMIVFFPIGFILLVINGADVIETVEE
jgi:hypothetical protein